MTKEPKHNIDFGPFKLRYENLTEDDLLKDQDGAPFIHWTIRHKTFAFIPKQAITKKVLLHPIVRDQDYGEEKVIHLLARDAQFKDIPKDILTQELLATKGRLGESVYHVLAKSKKLHLLPKKLLTNNANRGLIIADNNGWTPLHTITQQSPHLMPENIKLKDLLLKDYRGVTPLHTWASGSGWVNIPKQFLTKETLQLEDSSKQTPFIHVAKQFQYEPKYKDSEVFKVLLSQFTHILSHTNNSQLKVAINNPSINKGTMSLIKGEIVKRKLLDEMGKKEQSLEI